MNKFMRYINKLILENSGDSIEVKGDFIDREINTSIYRYGYSRPLNVEQIKEKGYEHLLDCPIHTFRAKTGIEMIHKEPTLKELNRIYDNWNNMTSALKKASDKKSLDFFGLTNVQHYNILKNEY
ncbi:MAG: hypothetical protein K9L64_04275 [Candidatus Izimaplasma sp.]|nr:hypothetical protein [Candidatus Izimaplasma bacterium]